MNPNPTCTREVVVQLPNGLHLGPSSQVVRTALRFNCEVKIRKGERTIDAKSMLDLMTLAAEFGAGLVIEATGPDSVAAVDALSALFEKNFATEGRA